MDRLDHLGYYWVAEFEDGSKLEQFNKDKSENLFKEIEERKSDLVSFSLVSKDGKEKYGVNLKEKTLVGPTKKEEVSGDTPKLVYFRRNNVRGEVGTGKVLESRLTHFLGLETDEDKKLFEISPQLHMRKKNIDFVEPVSNARAMESRFSITKEVTNKIKAKEIVDNLKIKKGSK
jgi:hypothetical protein